MNDQIIDLGRSLVELQNQNLFGEGRGGELPPAIFGRTSSWENALENRFVVLLGEPGSGKTTEIQLLAGRINSAGGSAFFLRLDDLEHDGFRNAIDPRELRRFEGWLSGKTPGLFLLDAADETKIKGGSIRSALKKLRAALDNQIHRACFVLTSRFAGWDRTSEKAFSEVFGRDDSNDDPEGISEELPAIFCLAPLCPDQFKRLASRFGVRHVDQFIESLAQSNFSDLLARPLDVKWATVYWKQNGTIPPPRVLIEEHIQMSMVTRKGRESKVAFNKRLESCEAIAGILVLSGCQHIAAPSGDDLSHDPNTADPRKIVPELGNEAIYDILDSLVFDPATLGKFQFHHRSVKEFLAARWFLRLLGMGLGIDRLISLFFKNDGDRKRIPRHLTGTLAWLGMWEPSICDAILESEPEVFLLEGDPSSLSPDVKEKVLKAYASDSRLEGALGFWFNNATLGQFASVELEELITKLLQDEKVFPEAKRRLVDIAGEGNLTGCANVCMELAIDIHSLPRIRCGAIIAMGRIGSPAQLARLGEIAQSEKTLEDFDLVGCLAKVLFPEVWGLEDLMQFFRHLPKKSSHSYTVFDSFLENNISENLSAAEKIKFVSLCLDELVGGDLSKTPTGSLVWLLGPASKCVSALLQEDDDLSGLGGPSQIVDFFKEQDNVYFDYFGFEKISDLISQDPMLRRRIFWDRAEQSRDQNGRLPTRVNQLGVGYFVISVPEEDASWLARDAIEFEDPLGRLLAFDALLNLGVFHPNNNWLRDIVTRISSNDQMFQKRLHRTKERYGQVSPFNRRFTRQQLMLDKKLGLRNKKNQEKLEAKIDELRTGEFTQGLMHLYYVIRKDTPSRYGKVNLEPIQELYGHEIASAAKEGFCNFWQKGEIPYYVNCDDPNSTPYSAAFGLTGVNLSILDGVRLESLDARTQRRAIEISLWEINDFPDWLETLAISNSKILLEVLSPCLKKEYLKNESGGNSGRIFDKLASAPISVREPFAEFICELVLAFDCKNTQSLKPALYLASSYFDEDFNVALPALAKARCQRCRSEIHFSLWWLTWANVEPIKAVLFLKRSTDHLDFNLAKTRIVSLLVQLGKWRRLGHPGAHGLSRSLEALYKLIPTVYHFLDPNEDLIHEGVHVVSDRETAEDMRRSLVVWVSENEDEGRVAVLENLVVRKELSAHSRWLKSLLEEAKVSRSPFRPLSIEQSLEVKNNWCCGPRSMADVHDLVLEFLRGYSYELEKNEYSIKPIILEAVDRLKESHFQILIASELRRARHRFFSPSREEEVGDRKKPDLRIHCPGVSGRPVSIEMKIAGNWTYRELLQSLKNQLVGQYLADPESKHGIFLLVDTGNRSYWVPKRHLRLSFEALVENLKVEAMAIQLKNKEVDRLDVVGLSFKPN